MSLNSQYPDCRDSGIGWLGAIPEHWETTRLGHLFSESNLRATSKKAQQLPILSVSIHHGISDKEMNEEELDRKVSRSEDRSLYKVVQENDLAYNMMRAWQGGFGAAKVPGLISPAYVVCRPRSSAGSQYFELLLRTPNAITELKRFSRGITDFRLRLYWDDFKVIEVPVPPEIERRSILGFLDYETAKIDALIEKQQQLIALLKEKRQAVISHAVTKGLNPDAPMRDSGVEWLGEVPAHWEVKQVRHVAGQLGGGTPSKDNEMFWNGDIPWVSPKDMKVDYISNSQDSVTAAAVAQSAAKLIPVGSVLIVVRGMILDHSVPTALTTAPVTINQDMKALVPCRNLDGEFLLLVLKGLRDYLLSHTDSSAHGTKCMATERLERTSIAVPGLSEQRELVRELKERVTRIDSLSESANDVSSLLQERRTALISAAVTGKIDVRNWTPPDSQPEAEVA